MLLEKSHNNKKENKNISLFTVSRANIKARVFIMVSIIIITPFFWDDLLRMSFQSLANLVTFVNISLLVLVTRMTNRKLWSASAMYLLVFSLFHFGATTPYGLGYTFSAQFKYILSRWFFTSFTKTALLFTLIGFFSCVLGIHIAFLFTRKSKNTIPHNRAWERPLTIIGFMLVTVGIFTWLIYLNLIKGANLIGGSYQSYLEAISTQTAFIGYLYFSISIGVPFLVAVPPSKLQKTGLIIFSIWALIVLPLGLRGEVLFPLSVALIISAKKGAIIKMHYMLPLLILILSMIAVIRDVRRIGLRDYSVSGTIATPVDALIEMGSSLRPVSEVIIWRVQGDKFINGASYWAPIERIGSRFIPGVKRIPAELDERLMNVLVSKRVGTIGFSPIAEAYRNFNILGIVVIMFFMGILVGKIDLWPVTLPYQALSTIILIPFFIQIRNSFTSVPFQLLVGGILFYMVSFWVDMSQNKATHKNSLSNKHSPVIKIQNRRN